MYIVIYSIFYKITATNDKTPAMLATDKKYYDILFVQ